MGCLLSFTLNCTIKEAKVWNCADYKKAGNWMREPLPWKREEFLCQISSCRITVLHIKLKIKICHNDQSFTSYQLPVTYYQHSRPNLQKFKCPGVTWVGCGSFKLIDTLKPMFLHTIGVTQPLSILVPVSFRVCAC